MQEQIKQLEKKVEQLTREVAMLTELVKQTSDTSYKTAKREIINREVQFLQKVYDKNGNVVTEINT